MAIGLEVGYKHDRAYVAGVDHDSQAARIGLRMGDRILSINGVEAMSPNAFRQAVSAANDNLVSVDVQRGNEVVTLTPNGATSQWVGMLTSTLNEIPGYRITSFRGLVKGVGSATGLSGGAAGKASDAFRDAEQALTNQALSLGANAVVGLQAPMSSASQGGILGDAVICCLIGSAVVIEQIQGA